MPQSDLDLVEKQLADILRILKEIREDMKESNRTLERIAEGMKESNRTLERIAENCKCITTAPPRCNDATFPADLYFDWLLYVVRSCIPSCIDSTPLIKLKRCKQG